MKKIFNIIYNPNILIDDGAAAITSGFVIVFKPTYLIPIMCWVHMLIEPLNDFLQYFEMEWLLSYSGWYEGMYDRTPKHNNALESTNKVIKTHHTLRARLSLSHYLDNAVTMIKQ